MKQASIGECSQVLFCWVLVPVQKDHVPKGMTLEETDLMLHLVEHRKRRKAVGKSCLLQFSSKAHLQAQLFSKHSPK